jgi:microcystin-dependent protein
MCQGQILPVQQYSALFALLGTQYGGNGTTTFGLPDLRSRVPVGQGQGPGLSDYIVGEMGGSETVTLTQLTIPSHTHALSIFTADATTTAPAGALPAKGPSSSTGRPLPSPRP